METLNKSVKFYVLNSKLFLRNWQKSIWLGLLFLLVPVCLVLYAYVLFDESNVSIDC